MAAMQEVRIAVIGMPGHGKSTFLNGLVGKRGEFEVGSGGSSCTQSVKTKEFDLEYNGVGVRTTLIDTMGFPDPNPANAAAYYDSVINSCNQPLNAIIWLMRCERELHALVSQYKVLMREFNNAAPPVILIVNGLENYEDDDERKERKHIDLHASHKFGVSIAEAAGIEVLKIIVGAEKGDLKGKVKDELAMSLLGTSPKASRMKTLQTLQKEVQNSKSEADRAKLETETQEEAQRAIKNNIEAQQNHISELRAWRSGTCWIPFVGWIAAAALSAAIDGAQGKIGDLHQDLKQSSSELRGLQQDKSRAARLFGEIEKAFASLSKALLG